MSLAIVHAGRCGPSSTTAALVDGLPRHPTTIEIRPILELDR